MPAYSAEGGVYGVPILCLDWEQAKHDFVWDGTYRNLGVEHCTLEHWQKLFEALANAPLPHALYYDNQEVPQALHSLETVFSPAVAPYYRLEVELAGAVLHGYFDDVQSIAFNYDASEINDEETFILLMGFLQLLHVTTGKESFVGDSREGALYLCSEETGNGPLRLL